MGPEIFINIFDQTTLEDFIVSYLLTIHTNESLPNMDFLSDYQKIIINWVTDNDD